MEQWIIIGLASFVFVCMVYAALSPQGGSSPQRDLEDDPPDVPHLGEAENVGEDEVEHEPRGQRVEDEEEDKLEREYAAELTRRNSSKAESGEERDSTEETNIFDSFFRRINKTLEWTGDLQRSESSITRNLGCLLQILVLMAVLGGIGYLIGLLWGAIAGYGPRP